MYHYSSPPGGWSATYDYVPQHFPYYTAHYAPPPQTPPRPKRHAYRASYSAAKDGAPWYPSPPPGYQAWQNYYEGVPDYASPPRKHEHVSATFGGRARGPRTRGTPDWRWQQPLAGDVDGDEDGYEDDEVVEQDGPFVFRFSRRSHTRPASYYADAVVDDAFDSSSSDDGDDRGFLDPPRASRRNEQQQHHYFAAPRHFNPSSSSRRHEPSSSSRRMPRKPRPTADQCFCYNQVPLSKEADSPRRSRARRASTSARVSPKPKPSASTKSPPKATEEDAVRAGIPSGYSIKNWDPTEAPILLLGSAFDANSLGKWIYDWTIFHYGAMAPMADVAGELWLLLIRLAGKVKRADECASLIRAPESREMVEDFLESGDRLWVRFKKLLKACEHFMWKTARRDGSTTARGSVTMGRNAGCEFVDSIFGRDRELEDTEKLMNSIRLWDMRFDANCDDILKRSPAA